MPPLVYYVAGLATQSVTVAGDFRQLPPIVMSDEPLAAEWLKRDVFENAGIPSASSGVSLCRISSRSGTQYRMREPICAVINKLFYRRSSPPLRPECGTLGVCFPLGSAPLLYVDTSLFHPWTALRVGTYSRYNLFHALLVRNIVLHLAETGFLPPGGEPNDAVGAVTPYASQARLIQALLDDRLGPAPRASPPPSIASRATRRGDGARPHRLARSAARPLPPGARSRRTGARYSTWPRAGRSITSC